MNEAMFIVAIDVTAPDLEIAHVRQSLTTHGRISNWWNYIPGVYLVKTDLSADQVSDLIKPMASDASFLVMEVNPSHSEGWLSDRAWRWIKRRSREARRTQDAS